MISSRFREHELSPAAIATGGTGPRRARAVAPQITPNTPSRFAFPAGAKWRAIVKE